MNGEIQYHSDITREVKKFLKDDILPELWMQIINTNVDLAYDEACMFCANAEERLKIYNREQQTSGFPSYYTFRRIGINPDKYLFAMDIRSSKQYVDSLPKQLEDLNKNLEILENRLRSLQRDIHAHSEPR